MEEGAQVPPSEDGREETQKSSGLFQSHHRSLISGHAYPG